MRARVGADEFMPEWKRTLTLAHMAKVGIFTDGSNLYHGAKRAGVRADPEKLAKRLLDF